MTAAPYLESPRRIFHPGLVASGATLLIAVFVSDALYWRTLLFQYNNFSQWLLTGGLIVALCAAIAFLIDLALGRVAKVAWVRFAGFVIVAVLGILNALVHSRDAYTAIVPEGIILSAIIAILLIGIGLSGGWSLVARTTTSTRL